VKLISLKRDELLSRLRRIVARLKTERPEVVDVRLFGSLARGDYTGTSDVDLLILLHSTQDNDPHQRALTYIPFFEIDRGVDLLVYTKAELNRRLDDQDHFITRIWEESISLL